MSHWSDSYHGLPYAEADCAQIAERVQREVFGREVSLPRERAAGIRGPSRQIRSLLDDYAERIDTPYEGCGVLLISRGRLQHVGIYYVANDGVPWVLHAMKNAGQTCRHRVVDLPHIGLAVEGYYAWK